jgi:hypothetical protein
VLLNKIFFIFLFLISFPGFAMDCDLAKAINHPSLAQRSDFWERLSTVNPKDSAAIRKLITEYSSDALATTAQASQAASRVSAAAIETSHKAEKGIAKLAGANVKHYDDFLKVINEKGARGFYDNPGKWHAEKLPQYGPLAHSIRLDSGYRVLFDAAKDGSVVVREVSKKVAH